MWPRSGNKGVNGRWGAEKVCQEAKCVIVPGSWSAGPWNEG